MNGDLDMNDNSINNAKSIHIKDTGVIASDANSEISFTKVDSQTTLTNINVGEPTKDTHAATKKYVDDSVKASGVPTATVAEAGKVLIVKDDGSIGWSDNIDAGNIN